MGNVAVNNRFFDMVEGKFLRRASWHQGGKWSINDGKRYGLDGQANHYYFCEVNSQGVNRKAEPVSEGIHIGVGGVNDSVKFLLKAFFGRSGLVAYDFSAVLAE